ncbi:hypothetical protein KESI111651_01305 [Kerstersia similis]
MKRTVPMLLAVAAISILSGCGESSKISQDNTCLYSSDEEAKACKPGELAYFRPASWGNQQLPLQVAALYCDFNHQIMHTDAGVLCVFTDKRLHLLDAK